MYGTYSVHCKPKYNIAHHNLQNANLDSERKVARRERTKPLEKGSEFTVKYFMRVQNHLFDVT